MIRQVIVRPLAEQDLSEAATWYEDRRSGLGEALIDEVIAAIRRAAENPEVFRIIRERGMVRRVLTQRFPYRVFFSVVSDTLYVHAILHGKRHDRHWRGRA